MARIEHTDANVGRCRGQSRLQGVEGNARIAQAQVAVLRVARIVKNEERALSALLGLRNARLHVAKSAPEAAGGLVEHQGDVAGRHAAQLREHRMDLARVLSGKAQGTRICPALIVARDEGESMLSGAVCRRGREKQGEQRPGPRDG